MKPPARPRFLAALACVSTVALGCVDDYEKILAEEKPTATMEAGAAAGDSGTDAGTGSDGGTAGDAGASNIVDGKPQVTIADGPLVGAMDGDLQSYLGIPYAKPPVGDLRWKLPVKNDKWTEPRDASKFGNRCAQVESTVLMNPKSDTEDCLYLNVWTSNVTPAKPMPVMVWIHGGGNQNGSASEALPYSGKGVFYSGKFLAKRDVVVVTFNYRLGAFGFFAHPAVAAEQGGAGGNQGLFDQVAALTWVKDNIAKFGGDPSNVTIFGESAGSLDVCLHVASPKSRDLFDAAISESGGCTTKQKTAAEGQAESSGRLAKALGCGASDIACLRSKSVADILGVASGTTGPAYNVVVDGQGGFLPDQTRTLFDSGAIAKVPYILGSNSDEGTLFTLTANIPDEAALRTALKPQFPDADIDAVLALYPASDYASAASPQVARMARIVGDARLVCSTYDAAIRMSAAAGTPGVWTYNFDVAAQIPGSNLGATLGATHGSELTYVFGTSQGFEPGAAQPASDQAVGVRDTMQSYWTNLAKKGDPNGDDGLPIWPKFSASMNKRIQFALGGTTVLDNFRKAQCEFWMKVYDAQFKR